MVEVSAGAVSIGTELSTSIATTSEGDEPHDATTNNIEKAMLGATTRERNGFTERDYARLQYEPRPNAFSSANGMSDD
jgi:hypothetical protein